MNKLLTWFKDDFFRILIGLLIIVLSLSATVVSTKLSIIGLTGLIPNSLKVDKESTKNYITAFVIIMQSIVFIGSIARGFFYKHAPQWYGFINTFTYIAFVISVLSTITFFNQFTKETRYEAITEIINMIPVIQGNLREWFIDTATNMSLIYIGAVALDIMSMKFPGAGSDLVFKIATKRRMKLDDETLFGRLIKIPIFLFDKLLSQIENKIGIENDNLKNPNYLEDEKGNKELEGNKENPNYPKDEKGNKELEGNKENPNYLKDEKGNKENPNYPKDEKGNKENPNYPKDEKGNKELEGNKENPNYLVEKLEGNKNPNYHKEIKIKKGNKELEGNKNKGNKTSKNLEGDKGSNKESKGNKVISIKNNSERNKISKKEQVKVYIMTHYKLGETLDTKEVRDHFNLGVKPWYTINQKLKAEGILETRGKRNYVMKVLEGNKEISN